MRLIHVTDTFLPKIGGAEIAIDSLARAMTKAGHGCAVLAQHRREMTCEIAAPYRVARYPNPRSSVWAGWWIGRHLAKLGRSFGTPDAVIGHHAFPPGYAAVRYAQHHGIPSIVYPRGGDIYEVSRFRKKKHAWRKLTWALTHATVVICASAAMQALVEEIIGTEAARGRIAIIPNGVDLPDLQADASNSRFATDPLLEYPFVLGLGRTIRRKGFHLLIEAADALPPGWKLVIAGDGRELSSLKLQASGAADRILFTGLVEGADKRWLLQHCQMMAAPSLEESFGNVALEGMACGKPVIASRASGFAEIVQDRLNGRLVAVNDVESLRNALRDCSTQEPAAMQAAALQTAERFSWETISRRYVELVTLLKQPRIAGKPHPLLETRFHPAVQ